MWKIGNDPLILKCIWHALGVFLFFKLCGAIQGLHERQRPCWVFAANFQPKETPKRAQWPVFCCATRWLSSIMPCCNFQSLILETRMLSKMHRQFWGKLSTRHHSSKSLCCQSSRRTGFSIKAKICQIQIKIVDQSRKHMKIFAGYVTCGIISCFQHVLLPGRLCTFVWSVFGT